MCIHRILILRNTGMPNVSALRDRGTFVGDSPNRPISIKNRRKLIAYTSGRLSIFYSIKTRVSFKREQGKEHHVYSRTLLIEDGIHKSLHFSASAPSLGFVVTRKTLPRHRYQKPPNRKSTLKRQQRERWAG